MPLPIAHSLAAGALYKGLDADTGKTGWRRLVLAVVIANAPDLDLIPGILVGEPSRYHHGWTHSIGMVLLVSLIGAAVARAGHCWPLRRRQSGAWATAFMVGLLWASHLLLDSFTEDTSPPAGPPVLWPLMARHFVFWPWFPYVDKLDGKGGPLEFVGSLMSVHNLWAVSVELLTLVPVVGAVVWWRRRTDRTRGKK